MKKESDKKVNKLPIVLLYGDGVHDDGRNLELIFNGKARGLLPDGREYPCGGTFFIGKRIIDRTNKKVDSQ